MAHVATKFIYASARSVTKLLQITFMDFLVLGKDNERIQSIELLSKFVIFNKYL